MNLPLDREFVTQSVIALGACLGAWMFLVQPKAEALTELEASIASLRTKATGMDHKSVEKIAQAAPMLRARSAEIQRRGEYSRDTSQLYGRIMDLAKEHDIQIKNLRPGDSKEGRKDSITVTRVDVTAEGEYEQMSAFFAALDGIGAYLRPVSVQIAPTKRAGTSYAVMQLGFEVLHFALPDEVGNMKRRRDEHS